MLKAFPSTLAVCSHIKRLRLTLRADANATPAYSQAKRPPSSRAIAAKRRFALQNIQRDDENHPQHRPCCLTPSKRQRTDGGRVYTFSRSVTGLIFI
jgi:hypothetical protein